VLFAQANFFTFLRIVTDSKVINFMLWNDKFPIMIYKQIIIPYYISLQTYMAARLQIIQSVSIQNRNSTPGTTVYDQYNEEGVY